MLRINKEEVQFMNIKMKQYFITACVAFTLMIGVGCVYFAYQDIQFKEEHALKLAQLQKEQEAAAKAELEQKLQSQKLYLEQKAKEEAARQNTETFVPQENIKPTPPKKDVVVNEDGSVDINTDYSKPEPPVPPTIPEDQKKDPTSKPEYPKDEIKPSEPNKPSGGDKNDKGETYVPGFGWIPPSGGSSAGDYK